MVRISRLLVLNSLLGYLDVVLEVQRHNRVLAALLGSRSPKALITQFESCDVGVAGGFDAGCGLVFCKAVLASNWRSRVLTVLTGGVVWYIDGVWLWAMGER